MLFRSRQQARDAAAALRAQLDLASTVVVASDLARARETAEIIAAGLGLEVSRLYPDLRERSYGEAEGLDGDEFLVRWGDWHTAEVPGAEPWPQLRARGLRALGQVVRDAGGRDGGMPASIIVVTHGAMIRELIRYATDGDLPLPGERLANGAAFSVRYHPDRLELLSYAPADA